MDEYRKEILTKEHIKRELMGVYMYNAFLRFLVFVGLSLFYWFIYAGMFNLIDIKKRITEYTEMGVTLFYVGAVMFIAIFGALYLFIIYSIYKFTYFAVKAHKGDFKVVIDKLIDSDRDGGYKHNITEYSLEELELQTNKIPFFYLFPKAAMTHLKDAYIVYRLNFEKYKNFYLPEGKLYRWSDKSSMEDWAVFRWSEIGDEFYLVVINDKKVLYVYNTKHFELQE